MNNQKKIMLGILYNGIGPVQFRDDDENYPTLEMSSFFGYD